MRFASFSLAIIILSFFGCTKPVEQIPLHIKLNSKAYISLKFSNIKSPISLDFTYWPNLAPERIELSAQKIQADTTIILEILAHMPQKHFLNIDSLRIPVFVTLSDTTGVSFDGSTNQVSYYAKNVSINGYYLSINHDTQVTNRERVKAYHNEKLDWDKIFYIVDSLQLYEESLLQKTDIKLPSWFISLESKNAEFTAAHFKLSAPNYRNFLNANEQNILSKQELSFLNDLDLASPYNKFLNQYYSFMNFYAFYLAFGSHYVNSDSVTTLFNNEILSTRMFELFNGDNINDENLLVFEVHQTMSDIKRNRDRKTGRLEYLKGKHGSDNPYIKYLITEHSKLIAKGLQSGDVSPDFYLIDKNGAPHTLIEQYGKIILLNIYTKGCVSCIREVPFEKALLQKFKEEQFQIVNICVTNSKEDFIQAVSRFQFEGLNVYTENNWSKIIKKQYSVSGFPHYVLIDRNGQIIMNNAYKPSNKKLADLIYSVI